MKKKLVSILKLHRTQNDSLCEDAVEMAKYRIHKRRIDQVSARDFPKFKFQTSIFKISYLPKNSKGKFVTEGFPSETIIIWISKFC